MRLTNFVKASFMSGLLYSYKMMVTANDANGLEHQVNNIDVQSGEDGYVPLTNQPPIVENQSPWHEVTVNMLIAEYFPKYENVMTDATVFDTTNEISAHSSAMCINLSCSEQSSNVNFKAYLQNSNAEPIMLADTTFETSTRAQEFELSALSDLKIKYYPNTKNTASFEISGNAGARPLHINTNCDVALNHVYSDRNISIKASANVFISGLRIGNENYAASIAIQAKALELREDISATKNIHINVDTIHVLKNVNIVAADYIFMLAKASAELKGNITAKHMRIRAENDISYDISKLYAVHVELQVSKTSQMQFSNNIATTTRFVFIGEQIRSTVSYELIGDDPNPIQILNESFVAELRINAPNNHVVVGSKDKKATLFGRKILIESKSLDISHGGVFGIDVLCIKSSSDIKLGAMDLEEKIEFGKHLSALIAYAGSDKLLVIDSGNKLALHQAELVVRNGAAWLRAEEFDNFGGTVRVVKDLYWSIKHANQAVLYENLPSGSATRINLPFWNNGVHEHYQITDISVQVKTPLPLIAVHGTMYIYPESIINIIGGTLYSKQIDGKYTTNIQSIKQIHKWGRRGRCGHKKSNHPNVKSFDNTFIEHERDHLGRLITYQDFSLHIMQEIAQITSEMKSSGDISSLLLYETSSINRLQLLYDAYAITTTSEMYEKTAIDVSFLSAAIAYDFITETSLSNRVNSIDSATGIQMALLDQVLHLIAVTDGIPVPHMPTETDKIMFVAIRNNDMAGITNALQLGANINAVDTSTPDLYSPLQLAITLQYYHIAKILVQQPQTNFRYLTSGASGKTALDLVHEKSLGAMVDHQDLVQIISAKTTNLAYQQSNHPVAIAERAAEAMHNRDREIMAARFYAEIQALLAQAKVSVFEALESELIDNARSTARNDVHLGLIEIALDACESGDLNAIIQLHAQADDLAWKMFGDCNPLLRAIYHDNLNIVLYLIDNHVGYLDLLFAKEKDSYTELAEKAQMTDMDLEEDSMLCQIAAHMQESIENLLSDKMDVPNQGQLRLTTTVLAHVIITRAKNMQWNELQATADTVLGIYEEQHHQFYMQRHAEIEAKYKIHADKFIHIFRDSLLQHGDMIVANAQYYTERLQEFKRMYEEALAKMRAEQENAERRARRKRRRKQILSMASVGAISWLAPQFTVALVQLGASAGAALVISGTASGGIRALLTGGNPIKGAAIGTITSFIGYTSAHALKGIDMPELVSVVTQSALTSGVNTIFYGGAYLPNFGMCAASNVIGTLLNDGYIQQAGSETQLQHLTKNLDDTLKVLLAAIPSAIISKGDKWDKLIRFANEATQTLASKQGEVQARKNANFKDKEKQMRGHDEKQTSKNLLEDKFSRRIATQLDISYVENVKISSEFIKHLEKQTNKKFTQEQRAAIRDQIKITKHENHQTGYVIHLRNGAIKLDNVQIVPELELSQTSTLRNLQGAQPKQPSLWERLFENPPETEFYERKVDAPTEVTIAAGIIVGYSKAVAESAVSILKIVNNAFASAERFDAAHNADRLDASTEQAVEDLYRDHLTTRQAIKESYNDIIEVAKRPELAVVKKGVTLGQGFMYIVQKSEADPFGAGIDIGVAVYNGQKFVAAMTFMKPPVPGLKAATAQLHNLYEDLIDNVESRKTPKLK